MTYGRMVVLLLGVLLSACGTPRLVFKTGQGASVQYKSATWNKSLEVGEEEFKKALEQLVLDTPLTLRSSQQGWLVRASYPTSDEGMRAQRLLRKSFGGMCKPGQRKEDCLSLLDDVMGLSEWDKLAVALGMSFEPLRESINEAVENTLAPQLFYSIIATGLVTWVVLAANPEPVFTKSAALVSAVMLIYLGVETFLEVVKASMELKRATDSATTFKELHEASARFAHRVGPQFARVVVLAITVVVSHGMTGGAALLASRLSMLPSFSETAALGASEMSFGLAQVGQVSSVAVEEGNLVISLAPTAVAMTTGRPGSGGGSWDIAEAGGRHAGFLRNYEGKPPDELRRGIDSLKKQIAEHQDKIANPEKHIPGWKSLDPRQQKALVEKKWPSDIQRQTEQLEILEELFRKASGINPP
jgi:hypothetical protein